MNSTPLREDPSDHAENLPGRKEILFVAALGVLFSSVWAVALGKAISWDQQNYHFYNVYAWLGGRMDYHVAPAFLQSWLNPLVYVPHYWLIRHVPPLMAGVLFGAVAGLNLALIYILARLVLRGCAPGLGMGLAFLCGVVGFSDPLFLGIIGATDADPVVSILVLGSLCSVCWAVSAAATPSGQCRAYALCGLLLGLAAGLKMTSFVYALGMAATLLVLWPVLELNRQRFLWFAGSGVAGFLATGGYWSWVLWSRYGNPTFPYWNRQFRSPWAEPFSYRDTRFLPQSFEDALSYPFQWFIGLHPSSEGPFRDARYAFLSVLIPLLAVILLAQWLARRWKRSEPGMEARRLADGRHLWFLLTFFGVSYVTWIKVFSIQRYLLPLGLLTGLLLLLTLDRLLPDRVSKLSAFLFLAAFCVLWMRLEAQDWRVPFGSSWFELDLPSEVREPDTLFILLGGGPMGYLVPSLPESARAIRLSPFTAPEPETELSRRAREIIAEHSGPIRSLETEPPAETDFAYLSQFNLILDRGDCRQFRSAVDRFTTCRLARQTPPDSTALPAP